MKKIEKKKVGRPSSGAERMHLTLSPIVKERIKADAKNEDRSISKVVDRALRIGLGIDQ